MSIQFAGSRSQDDRRRRRLAVSGDGTSNEGGSWEEGGGSGRVESELVASAAAAPWVPVYEWRIWTYGAMLGLVLIGVSFSLVMPTAFRPELAPLTNHLLHGSRPVLASTILTLFWFLCAQLAVLIAWYRAQCKLDFGGRYRVWPWVAGVFALASLCSATNAHTLLGAIVASGEWIPWNGSTVAWLLPACTVSLPLMLLVDRDVRRGRSSLYTLRAAWTLGIASACLELLAPTLGGEAWYRPVRLLVPIFGTAALFLGLWLHARVVAYICPDPPEFDEPGAMNQLWAGCRFCAQLVSNGMGFVWKWTFGRRPAAVEEAEPKPKRRSRKTADLEEAPATKRKRKTPTKRASKPRTRVKVVEEEEEEVAESEDDSYVEESDDSYENSADESSDSEQTDSEWEEEQVEESPPPPPQKRSAATSSPAITPQTKKAEAPSWREQEVEDDSSSGDDSDSDESYRVDDGISAEQMRGLSKRQKRELRQRQREQQRNQRR